MVRIEIQVELNYEVFANGADFIFNIHAAQTPRQTVSAESLMLSQSIDSTVHADPGTGNRYLRLRALPGPLPYRHPDRAGIFPQRRRSELRAAQPGAGRRLAAFCW